MMRIEQFSFVEDKPLDGSVDGLNLGFGHEELSRTLETMIIKVPSPFTIGLFAKWGTGKSTVAKSLKEPLKKQNIPMVIFDVWKHEGDALRRTFLKELHIQLNGYGGSFFNPRTELSPQLDKRVTEETEGKLKINQKLLKLWLGGLLLVTLLLYLGGRIAHTNNHFEAYFQTIVGLIGLTSMTGTISLFLRHSGKLFYKETFVYQSDKFSDPHEFEKEFSNILKGLKHKRVLIVFDNLDRVPHDKVFEILSTIKTFLEPLDKADTKREVIFLIPCDASAIKRHISSVFEVKNAVDFDSDEFLRKFFNTILWIPEFIQAELETFAQDTLRRTEVALLDDKYVAWIIVKAFRENPRQIIQFVNILLANYLLIRERQGSMKDFPADFLSKNMGQLTKFLILVQLYPDEVNSLRVSNILNLDDVTPEIVHGFDSSTGPSIEVVRKRAEFIDFLAETKHINIENIGVFVTLRRSEQEKSFPGFEEFVAALEDQRLKDAAEHLLNFGDYSDSRVVEGLSQALKKTIQEKTNSVSAAYLIGGLFEVLVQNGIILSTTLDEDIHNSIVRKCKGEINLIGPVDTNLYLFARNANYVEPIISLWLGILGESQTNTDLKLSRTFILEVFEVVMIQEAILTGKQIQTLKKLLSFGPFAIDKDISQIVAAHPDVQHRILTAEYVNHQIQLVGATQIMEETVEALKRLCSLTTSIFELVEPRILIEQLTQVQLSENAVPYRSEKTLLAKGIAAAINEHLLFLKSAAEAIKVPFVASIMDGYNKLPAAEDKQDFIPTLIALWRFAPESYVPTISEMICAFIRETQTGILRAVLAQVSDSDKQEFFKEGSFFTQIKTRAVAEQDFLDEFFKDFSEVDKITFVDSFLLSHFANAMFFVGTLGDEDLDLKLRVFRNNWNLFETSTPGAQAAILASTSPFLAISERGDREVVLKMAIKALSSSDVSIQELGLNSLELLKEVSSDGQKRQIAKSMLDLISNSSTQDRYQPFVARALYLGYSQLNAQEQGTFIQYLFDELIRRGDDVQSIALGYELLTSIKPAYEDRPQNFDDVVERIDTIGVGVIREALLQGLKSLAPADLLKSGRDFWDSVAILE